MHMDVCVRVVWQAWVGGGGARVQIRVNVHMYVCVWCGKRGCGFFFGPCVGVFLCESMRTFVCSQVFLAFT